MQQWTWNLLANVVPPCCREATFVTWQTILGKGGAWCIPFNKRLTSGRSHNRGRRQQVRGPCSSIEIAKGTVFRTNCTTLNVTNSRGNPPVQEMGDRFAALFERFMNFPRASSIWQPLSQLLRHIFFQILLSRISFYLNFCLLFLSFIIVRILCKTQRAAIYARYKCFIIIIIIIII